MIGEIIQRVKDGMVGRMCDESDNVRLLLEAVRDAGDGDYVEIGVLFGGSLCAVGLLKEHLKQKGTCYGIDPFDGYYKAYTGIDKRAGAKDPLTKLLVIKDNVDQNIQHFRLTNRVKLIQAYSNPLPFNQPVRVAYIDGDHWGDAPTIDWQNVSPLVTDYVVIDNADYDHPAVQKAVVVASADPDWELYLFQGITAIFRRVK